MAVATSLLTYPDATFTPQDFSIMLDRVSVVKTGILYGCTVAAVALTTNQVSVPAGWVAVRGRLVKVSEGTLEFALPSSGEVTRYVIVEVDLANTTAPSKCDIYTEIPSDETADFNFNNGKAYCVLATIAASPTGITTITPAPKPEKGYEYSYTLAASSWDTTNKTYTITSDLISSTSDQEYLPAIGITDTQLKALQKANIQDNGQTSGSATLKAYGTVPSIDIPIRIKYLGG